MVVVTGVVVTGVVVTGPTTAGFTVTRGVLGDLLGRAATVFAGTRVTAPPFGDVIAGIGFAGLTVVELVVSAREIGGATNFGICLEG
jgi:hypothetical protein